MKSKLNVKVCKVILPFINQIVNKHNNSCISCDEKSTFEYFFLICFGIRNTQTPYICKNIFASLLSVHDLINLLGHEQVCLMRLRFKRYFSQHWTM